MAEIIYGNQNKTRNDIFDWEKIAYVRLEEKNLIEKVGAGTIKNSSNFLQDKAGTMFEKIKNIRALYVARMFGSGILQFDPKQLSSFTEQGVTTKLVEDISDSINNEVLLKLNNQKIQSIMETAHAQMKDIRQTKISKGSSAKQDWDIMVQKLTKLIAIVENLSQEDKAALNAMAKGGKTAVIEKPEKLSPVVSQIIKYLKDSNPSDSKSWSSTLNSILSTTIGERLAALGLHYGTREGAKVFTKKLGSFELVGSEPLPTDQLTSTVFKVDVGHGKHVSLTLEGTGEELILKLNTSVKWYTGKYNSSKIDVFSTTRGKVFLKDVFGKTDAEAANVIFNTLVFTSNNKSQNSVLQNNYRLIRTSVLGKYLIDFIAGSGHEASKTKIDFASLIMYNGRYYSMLDVLGQIEKEAKDKNSSSTSIGGTNSLISMPITFNNNKRGEKDSISEGFKRSRAIMSNQVNFNVSLSKALFQKLLAQTKPLK